ncbi:MAG: replication-associated recombination protein A [Patescibacteria group bacterium]|nr:MAG: replication-associated recombination protein A [Patescibacteria group bacterium]
MTKPLAEQVRPQNLKKFVGQKHLVGEGKPITLTVEKKRIHSMLFWGPPGCGKTTLARIVAGETGAQFFPLSAVSAGKADVKKVVDMAKDPSFSGEVLLFIDEIHRFNKAQQDYLLPYVEDGTVTLIGATTENPSFEVIPPLLSRCQVFVLEPLSKGELKKIIKRGVQELQKSPQFRDLATPKEAVDFLIEFANGDARQALNLLEAAAHLYQKITLDNLKNALQSKLLRYDRAGEEHYNTVSAYIKSMRAGDVDAALYYLARMVDAGEDPLFIARRMIIFASEDIGVAQPTALVVANEVFRACETIGYPECAINLAHGTVHLAKGKKDRTAYEAYFKALEDVRQYGNLPIPLNLRNASTKLMKKLGYGEGYEKYSQKSLLPKALRGKRYFSSARGPTARGGGKARSKQTP